MSRQLTKSEVLTRERDDFERRKWAERGESERRARHERATQSSNVDVFTAAVSRAQVNLSKADMKKLLCAFSDIGYSLKR